MKIMLRLRMRVPLCEAGCMPAEMVWSVTI